MPSKIQSEQWLGSRVIEKTKYAINLSVDVFLFKFTSISAKHTIFIF